MTSKNTRFALLIGAALVLSGCELEPPAKELVRPVRAMKVGDVVELQGRNFPGRAKATQEVDLSFRVAGPLIALPVKVGDKVKEGDLVAALTHEHRPDGGYAANPGITRG